MHEILTSSFKYKVKFNKVTNNNQFNAEVHTVEADVRHVFEPGFQHQI